MVTTRSMSQKRAVLEGAYYNQAYYIVDECMHARPKSLRTKCRLICSVTVRTKRSFRSRVWLLWNYLTSIVKKLMASGTKAGSSSTPSFSTLRGATGSSSEFDQLIFRSGATFGDGQLTELALKLAQLQD